jgi:hypothetical protein
LEKVLDRVPAEINKAVLTDKGFQIIADEGGSDVCKLRYDFDEPVLTLIYFNTKILLKPEHWIIYKMAKQIAQYVLSKNGGGFREQDVDATLENWGFKREVNAVRYDTAITKLETYKIGYKWAKKQNADYLMQHFGLYFDEWNEKGIEVMSKEKFERVSHTSKTAEILEDMIHLKRAESVKHETDNALKTVSVRKAMLAGIMAAMKELMLKGLYRPQNCLEHHPTYINIA